MSFNEEQLNNEELQLFSRRGMIIKGLISLPLFGISWRLWDLQIKKGEDYKELSKGNRIRLLSVPAPRGIIYDINHVILCKNIPSYNLMLVQEDVKDLDDVLAKISRTLQIKKLPLKKAIKNDRYAAKYQPIQIYKNLTFYQMALINSYQEEFPGISIEVSSRRFYPFLQSGSQIFGYMNQITRDQLKKLPLNKLMSARVIGQEGIEKVYNDTLIGKDGGVQVEVDSAGRTIKTLKSIDPIPGKDVKLSIDHRLQREVEKIFGVRKGAAVIMNPHNGDIYSMVSLPSFDPNEFSQGLSVERWNELLNHPDKLLNNKAIQGVYSPGSTFKMLVGLAALDLGVIQEETEHLCEGYYRFNNLVVHCWKRSGHGNLNLTEALEQSCNIFFYKLAMEIGVDKIKEYANMFGLGFPTGVDLYNEKSGLIPNKKWKLKRFNETWFMGETLPVAIGQGYVSVTPLQLLNYINVIINGGYLVTPKIANQIITVGPENETEKQESGDRIYTIPSIRKKVNIRKEHLLLVREGMRRNVQGARGTGVHARSDIVPIGGKTGTTQVVSYKTRAKIKRERGVVDEKYFDHAWFTGFAPFDNPMISVAVIIENGKTGRNAALLVKKIMEYYFTEIVSYQPDMPPPYSPKKYSI